MASGINSTVCPAPAKISATRSSCSQGLRPGGMIILPFLCVIMCEMYMIGKNFASISGFDFCLGRQLPTYNGTKSYQNLLVGVYGIQVGGSWSAPLHNPDSVMHQSPLNFSRSGYYSCNSGSTNSGRSDGYYHSSRTGSATTMQYLNFNSTYLLPLNNYYERGAGITLRCLVR